MSFTVHQAKMSFISGKSGGVSHLKAHLSYVSREKALHFAYNATGQALNKLFNFAHEKLRRRKDARIAFRMHIALPYLWYVLSREKTTYLELKARELTKFIADTLQLNKEDIMLFFHKPEPEENSKNFHVHVVAIPQTKDGKALDISPAMVKSFHQKLDEFLAEQGFQPFRYRDLPELGLNKSQIKALNLPAGVYKREPEVATAIAEKRRAIRMYAEEEVNKRNKQVHEFCNILYSKDETVWIMLRNSQTGQIEHRKKKVAEISNRFLTWLRYKNAQNFDIYITLNSFRSDSTRRVEQEIEQQQDKIWLDLDSEKLMKDGLEVLKQIMHELNLPPPTVLVRTSETSYGRNYQAIWRFEQKVDFSRLKRVMQELEKRYGLDATHDGARVFRLPGFNNKKQGKVGRDLCSLVGVSRVYDLSLLEKLELKLAKDTHDVRTACAVPRKKEEAKPQPQTKPEAQPKPQQQLKPETKPEPKPQQKPEPQQEQKPKPEPEQDQQKKLLTYRLILMREARELVGQSVHIPYPSKLNDVATNLKDLEISTAKELLHHMSVQETEEKMRQILAKYRPKLPENYLKELMLEAYQLLLEKIAEKNGIRTYLSLNAGKSYSEIEWAFAKELAREALYRFSTVEEAFEKAYKFFERIVQKHRPEKLEKSPNYAELTMRKAFEQVLILKEELKQQPRPGL